ncbi:MULTISPECIES: hypothetical protein [unclassified Brevibacillus]|uniref:hypothetical protein n=1 Tax=unclassified Brevibacillus TaxID=2684853 RepID=UPI003566E472
MDEGFTQIQEHFFDYLRELNDVSAVTLAIHLHVEYLIDRLIREKSPTAKEILTNSQYTFSIKLNLVYNMGLIPEYIFTNIKKLNKLRNGIAHNLNIDLSKQDLNFQRDDNNSYDVRVVEGDINKLMTLAAYTFGFLDYHCSREHGIRDM